MSNNDVVISTINDNAVTTIPGANFGFSLLGNVMHAIKTGFLTTLSVATQANIPGINSYMASAVAVAEAGKEGLATSPQLKGLISPVIPIALFAIDIMSDCYDIKVLNANKTEIAHHRHEIVSEGITDFMIAGASAYIVSLRPELALPVIGFVAGAQVLLAGDNSPMEYFKDGITWGLDKVLGDWI